jgi:hypothetical protein
MSMPGFSAQAALSQVSRTYRIVGGHRSATAGVEPARAFLYSHCTPPSDRAGINWSCEVRWGIANCRGSVEVYADGQIEEEHSCA